MKRLRNIATLLCSVVVAVFYVLPTPTVSAAESSALSIAPKKNYVIEPGKSVDDTLTIRNLDVQDSLELRLRVVDFTYMNDSGTPKLMLDPDAAQTTWSLRSFLTVPETVTVAPRSSASLKINVKIPAGHGAGSYYSAIVYSTGAPESGNGPSNVGLSASGVTLVFVNIPGDVNEDLKLQNFGAYTVANGDKQAGYVGITTQEPLRMAYTLKNNGNVTESPAGTIIIKDLFGHTYTISRVNPTGSLALIGQSRTFTTCIKQKTADVELSGTTTQATDCVSPGLWPGPHTATIGLLYGQNGNLTKELNGSTVFWYLPIWFIILCLVIVALIGYGIWRLKRKRASRSRRNQKAPRRGSR